MFKEIKRQLLEEPENIVTLLEAFGFERIRLRSNEIRFARDDKGGANISIRLHNNEYLNVADYARSVFTDIFSYIVQEKDYTLREVLVETKRILGLDDYWQPPQKKMIFGGIYANLSKPNSEKLLKIYGESVLEQYIKCGNKRFLNDYISLLSQKKFGVGYNPTTNRITIPIRNVYGDLCGVKARRNYETEDDEDPKYIYEIPCQKSRLLYGAHENYQYLVNADKIFIGESEKLTMACDSYGYNNVVSIMGSTLSEEQAKILLSFNAKEYVFLHDEGLDMDIIYGNGKMLRDCAVMRDFKVSYWDYTLSLDAADKCSPTDMGKEIFEEIINSEIRELTIGG